MKPRIVIVTLEIETDLTVAKLRSVAFWGDTIEFADMNVLQAQANMIKTKKKAKKAKKR